VIFSVPMPMAVCLSEDDKGDVGHDSESMRVRN
jgi:hypothetical protein